MKTPETKAFKTLIRGIDGDKHWVPAGFAEILDRERDEARADAAALADKLSGLELRTTEELARLEQERDEAREIAQQHENANPETITEAIKRWNISTKK